MKFTDLRDTRHQWRSLPSWCCSVDCLCQCSPLTPNLTSSSAALGKCNTSYSSSTENTQCSVELFMQKGKDANNIFLVYFWWHFTMQIVSDQDWSLPPPLCRWWVNECLFVLLTPWIQWYLCDRDVLNVYLLMLWSALIPSNMYIRWKQGRKEKRKKWWRVLLLLYCYHLCQRSSTGGPRPLGGQRRYCRGVASGNCCFSMIFKVWEPFILVH